MKITITTFIKNIFPYTLLFFSLLILSYIFYRDQILYNGNNFIYYKTYYFLGLSTLALSFISILIKKSKIYIFIILLTIMLSVYLFETYLTIIKFEKTDQNLKIEEYKKKTGKDYDQRSIIKVYNDLVLDNTNVAIKIFPNLFLNSSNKLYPLSGISNSKTVYDNENGYYFIYQSDRYGFNNPNDEWDKKKIDYLLVGDSFVHGATVNRPDDISSVLRKISKKNVLNISYGGNGPLLQFATLIEYMPKNTKNIIWFYYEGNDNYDLTNELKNKTLIKYIRSIDFKQDLKFKQNKIDLKLKRYLGEFIENNNQKTSVFEFRNFIKLNNLRKLLHKTSIPSEFREILIKVQKLSRSNNSDLLFVYLPEHSRYSLFNYSDNNRKEVVKILKDLNISFIDVHKEVFAKSKNALEFFPFNMYGHYNKNGYEFIAKEIYKYFTKAK